MVLLCFAGLLFAVFLRSLTNFLVRHTRLGDSWALTLVIVALLGFTGGLAWLLAPQITEQTRQIATELPNAALKLQKQAEQSSLGRMLLRTSMDVQQTIWRLPASLASSLFGTLTGVIVVFFLGLYLACNPAYYRDGIVCLLPPHRRTRVREILEESGVTLERWLMTQLALMTLNAIVMSIGLSLLKVPMPVALGIMSGLLNFIPTFGPVIAAIPAVILTLAIDPGLAIQVALLYFGYQMFDGYVLTPLIQERAVYLPAALTIVAQVILGALLGAMGVIFAVPLIAVGSVIVKMAYMEDVLGGHPDLPGQS